MDNNDQPIDKKNNSSFEDDSNKKIKLKILDSDGSVLEFKVKKAITFKKILNTYAENVNKDPSELRLIFNGKVLNLNETPDDRNMEDNDELEVVASQVGGM